MTTTEFPYLMISRAGELRFRTSDVIALTDIAFFKTHADDLRAWESMNVFEVAASPLFAELLGRAIETENGTVPGLDDIDIRSLPVLMKAVEVWTRGILIRIAEQQSTDNTTEQGTTE
jgi:hypothetical protein